MSLHLIISLVALALSSSSFVLVIIGQRRARFPSSAPDLNTLIDTVDEAMARRARKGPARTVVEINGRPFELKPGQNTIFSSENVPGADKVDGPFSIGPDGVSLDPSWRPAGVLDINTEDLAGFTRTAVTDDGQQLRVSAADLGEVLRHQSPADELPSREPRPAGGTAPRSARNNDLAVPPSEPASGSPGSAGETS